MHIFNYMSSADLKQYINADSLYYPITIHTYAISHSCPHLYLLNNDLMTPPIFHPSMQYPLCTSTSNLFAKQDLYLQISKFFSAHFLHLSMCDVLQRQLLSSPSPRPESAGQIHSIASYRSRRSWLKYWLLGLCGPFAIAENAGYCN